MLHIPEVRPEIQNSSNAPHVAPDRPVRVMTGRRLSRVLKHASARDRTLLGYELERGAVQIQHPTRAQAATLVGTSSGYLATVARLSDDERLQLARGELSLSRLHNRRRDLSDAELDRVVERYGEALWRAFDRATAPSSDSVTINGVASE